MVPGNLVWAEGAKASVAGSASSIIWTFGRTVYLLTSYSKAAQEDLSPDEKAELVQLITEFQATLEE
jgi:hypothetical protein